MASTDVEKSKSPPPHQLTSSQSSGARSQSPAATSYEPKDVDDVPESTSQQKEPSEVPTTSSDIADEQRPIAISDDEDEDESRVNKTPGMRMFSDILFGNLIDSREACFKYW